MSALLAEARLQAHWAAQLASAPGTSLIPPRDDFTHTNLRWVPALRALVGQEVDGKQAALRLEDLTLRVADATLALPGRTYDEALAWLGEIFGAPLHRSKHEMPAHAIAEGEAFAEVDGLSELAALYARAHQALSALGPDVICWPHHFDIAALHDLGEGRSVGTGMSPGDGSYPDPYWYVTPWPYPDDPTSLPALSEGAWHTEGWVGAVLPSTEAPEGFLSEALAVARALHSNG